MINNHWYRTISPHEHYESEGTHCFSNAMDILCNKTSALKYREVTGFHGAYCAVTREPNELFLLYGCIAPDKKATGACIAKLDTETLSVQWQTRLINTKQINEWNYPGAIGVHKNGFIYVVYGYRLSKIDPNSGTIIKTIKLPTLQPAKDVAYNGFIVMGDGCIVTKSVHRKIGCKEDGFRAYIKCGPSKTPSTIAVVCPDEMKILSAITCNEMIGSRICAGFSEGKEYVYMAGLSKLHRYIYSNKQLNYDQKWGPVNYLRDHQTNGSAPAILGNYVLLNTNGMPTPSPMDVIAISQQDSTKKYRHTPFANSKLSFNPCKITIDPENSIVYVMDGLASELAALKFEPDVGFKLIWKTQQSSFSFMNLIGQKSNRILVSNEIILSKFTKWLRRIIFPYFKPILYVYRHERVIWRNALTGEILRKSSKLARGGFTSTPGFNSKYYVPTTFAGKFYELQLFGE